MKILVGYDGSNAAKEALTLAKRHGKAFNGSIHVVTSMEKATDSEQALIDETESALAEAKSEFAREEIPCETHLLIRGNSPGEDLVQFARENDIDEVVVGVRRRSKVGKLLMGSTAQYVILKAHCPVTSVK